MKKYSLFFGIWMGLMIMAAGGFFVFHQYQNGQVAGTNTGLLDSDTSQTKGKIIKEESFSVYESKLDQWEIIDAPGTTNGPSDWQLTKEGLVQYSSIHGLSFGRPLDQHDYAGSMFVYRDAAKLENYEFNFTFDPGKIDHGLGAIVRYQDDRNYYRILTLKDNSSEPGYGGQFIRIDKMQSGKLTMLYYKNLSYINNQINSFKIQVKNSKIDVYLNSKEPVIWVEDQKDPLTRGSFGFVVFDQPNIFFKQLKVICL